MWKNHAQPNQWSVACYVFDCLSSDYSDVGSHIEVHMSSVAFTESAVDAVVEPKIGEGSGPHLTQSRLG